MDPESAAKGYEQIVSLMSGDGHVQSDGVQFQPLCMLRKALGAEFGTVTFRVGRCTFFRTTVRPECHI
jgi:hypothetical protein